MHQHNSRARLFPVFALVALGCGGGLDCGGGCLAPYPAGEHYVGPKSDNAVNVRLSPAGVQYINTQWQTLLAGFLEGNQINVPVGCAQPAQEFGTCQECGFTWPPCQDAQYLRLGVTIADQGNGTPAAAFDGNCQPGEAANVSVTVTGVQLVPTPPNLVRVVLSLGIDTGTINVRARGAQAVFECDLLVSCSANCTIRFNTAHSGHPENQLGAQVAFSIDERFDRLLAFELTTIDGSQICGASGAPPAPGCLDANDLIINSQGGSCGWLCDAIGNDTIKQFILQQLSGPLQSQLAGMLDPATCFACETAADCPARTDGSATPVTCTDNVCMSGGKCAPLFLGTEGKINLHSLLGSFGAPEDAELELFGAAGSTASVDTGINIGTRIGIQPGAQSNCVPARTGPDLNLINFPAFDAEAPATDGGAGYQLALGVSSQFLNGAAWGAHQAGALCLAVTSEASGGFVTTGLLKTFLPSLGTLTERDGQDAPMLIVLRPAQPPRITVGEGTYNPVTNQPVDPLLRLALDDLSIDFYALIDDRQVRLFTLTADLSVPLSLIFEGCDTVTPALGDISQLIANVRTANSELMAEDPQALADLIPTVIGLIEPMLGDALSPIALPSLGSFKLRVRAAKGVNRIGASSAFEHLAIYADLMDANAACATLAPELRMSLARAHIPEASQMRLGNGPIPWPSAVLNVEALGLFGTPQFSYKIDNGLWTDFITAPSGELTVSHPKLTLQGRHTIAVRTRIAESPHGVSRPKVIDFVVDYAAPDVTLKADHENDRLLVIAHDSVSGGKLEYAYAVGAGEPSDFGPARKISLSAVEVQGGVTVLVRDEAGHVGQAKWQVPTVSHRGPKSDGQTDVELISAKSGCSTSGAFGFVALAIAGLLRRKRR